MPFENARIVHLLDPPELTPRQLAQKRYQQSAKGKAAAARGWQKRRQNASYRAQARERALAWQKANPMKRRVYKRTWQRMTKVESARDCCFKEKP